MRGEAVAAYAETEETGDNHTQPTINTMRGARTGDAGAGANSDASAERWMGGWMDERSMGLCGGHSMGAEPAATETIDSGKTGTYARDMRAAAIVIRVGA